MTVWIRAMRLRTLPLAVAAIALGCVLALHDHVLHLQTGIWAGITAILLQILSNLANDLGDFDKGTDQAAGRPDRSMASGEISRSNMLRALVLVALLAFGSGLLLLYRSLGTQGVGFVIFLGLGLLSIGASMRYTMGTKAYGYRALGDLAVFLFFGWIAVGGTYYLQAKSLLNFTIVLLPASAFGLLSVGVLNINNIRDIQSDRDSGKRTIAGILGRIKSEWYQLFLVCTAFALAMIYMRLRGQILWSFVMLLPVYIWQWMLLRGLEQGNRTAYNRALKVFVLLNLLWVLLFSVQVWHR